MPKMAPETEDDIAETVAWFDALSPARQVRVLEIMGRTHPEFVALVLVELRKTQDEGSAN